MKKVYLICLLIIALMLSACGAGKTAQPIPTIVLDSGTPNSSATQSAPQVASNGNTTASGVVQSVQEAQLAFALAETGRCADAIPLINATYGN